VLIAITATAIGFAYDAGSGSEELSTVYAACYVLGCIAAVLAVRQAAVFTAVIQPPLLLFVSVPTAYFLFTGSQLSSPRNTAINCGYPLIERFPLMFFTSAVVLLIGIIRWCYGMSPRRALPDSINDEEPKTGLASSVTAKMSSLFARITDDDEDEGIAEAPPRRRSSDNRSRRSTPRSTSSRGERPSRRSTPSRSRHVRPPDTEIIEPVADRPRRTRTDRTNRQAEPPSSAEPRRRSRTSNQRTSNQRTSNPRTSNPRKAAPPPSERRNGQDRQDRRRRFDDYEPREPHGRNGNGTGTHHPISRVRYRGEETDDRAEYRTRRRTTRDREAGSRQYDI
jgi:hypothetical protein